ncbi:MAG TPA: DUF1572 family protein [Vicinamibacteria bacterium]|nr:DUF1572 family protein [Vicinamibacteria bacterium]
MELPQLYLENARFELARLKKLADGAMAQLPDEAAFHRALDAESNSVAILIQHLSGNMVSRFTDFLLSDGEKPQRHRDREFESSPDRTREELMAIWERGFACAFESLDRLAPGDLDRTLLIRGEEHTVTEALQRHLIHCAYHVGQIVMLAKHLAASRWKSLSIPRGKSQDAVGRYKKL